jgi:hypothetical protein
MRPCCVCKVVRGEECARLIAMALLWLPPSGVARMVVGARMSVGMPIGQDRRGPGPAPVLFSKVNPGVG